MRSVSVLAALFILAMTPWSFSATDPVQILSSQTRIVNAPCRPKSPCDLKNFSLQVDNYLVNLPGPSVSYGTRSIARYETHNVNQVEEYGIAQFLRGCQYTSSLDEKGQIVKSQDIAIEIAGHTVDYHFPKFIIDGFVSDPLDWGDQPDQPDRHYYYQWNQVPGSVDPATSQWYGQAKPTNPALYVVDHPGTAFYTDSSHSARNISVQFRSCLYKADEVPKDLDPTNINFAKPLACLDWASSFIYNFKTGKMDSPDALDPFCLEGKANP